MQYNNIISIELTTVTIYTIFDLVIIVNSIFNIVL